MNIRKQQFIMTGLLVIGMIFQGAVGRDRTFAAFPASPDDASFQALPFSQSWSDTTQVGVDDNWSGVPGMIAYRGDNLTTVNGTDPQTILTDGITTPVDVIANQTDPVLTMGGVAEFEITDPVVAMQGSLTADAPFLLLSLNSSGYTNIQTTYILRDIDASADNAVQPVALQYRVGTTGNFSNLAAGFVADATTGPSLATLVTPISVTLPAEADNQAQLQIRIITTNASGNDEWVGVDNLTVTGTPTGNDPDACGAAYTPIFTIQGNGAASSLDNAVVSTEGVVIGDYQATGQLDGFFLQAPVGDGDATTSDGLFAYAPGGLDVQPGDLVRVKGEVDEFNGLTEMKNIAFVKVCSTGQSIALTTVDLPLPAAATLEPYENMLVVLPETLTVTEHYNLGRFGEAVVAADGRLYEPTNDQGGSEDLNRRRKLILDDGSITQNPATVPYLAADNTLRLGDTVTNLTGVLSYGFSQYRVIPTVPPAFLRANPRQAGPQAVGGTLRVASMNVLNYFNGDGLGSGFPTSRGASTLQEFERQRAKVIQAIVGLDAAVIGLMEIEKDGTGPHSAIQDLVNGLNAASAPGAYDFIREPAPGTDAIKVAMIYKPAVVTPAGPAQNYQTSAAGYSPLFERPPLAQLFEVNASGEKLTIVVNHFKSKGSCPDSGPDADAGDGQGCWNAKRVAQAASLLDFVASLTAPDPDVLVLGDLNSYGLEDPIDTLIAGGLVNQVAAHVPLAQRYSYVFDGQAGYLDQALTTSSLHSQVKGATIWHINADEPRILDYNTEFNPAYLYLPNAFRSSDHDPVIVGLDPGAVSLYLPQIFRP